MYGCKGPLEGTRLAEYLVWLVEEQSGQVDINQQNAKAQARESASCRGGCGFRDEQSTKDQSI